MLAALGISAEILQHRGFIAVTEADTLVLAEVGADGREYLLTPAANQAWQAMKNAAAADGIALLMISAFRSIQRQADIIQTKLESGQSIQDILQVCAPPGYSEHHSGRAIDIATPEDPELEISFDTTAAFRWLQQHAHAFGFDMSYPPQNSSGYQYEPWHWCYRR